MHDVAERFLDICRGWRRLIDQAHVLTFSERLEALAGHVAHVYGAGLRLPAAQPWEGEAPELAEWSSDWVGMGPLDAMNPSLTMLLRGLGADLDRGVVAWERESPEAAVRWWRHTFDQRWGQLALACLDRLHMGLIAVRKAAKDGELAAVTVPAPREQPADKPQPDVLTRGGGVVLPSFEPAPPTRKSSGRQRARVERGVLGLRFEEVDNGVAVRAVHPAGPAAGVLEPGDVILSAGAVSLAGRTAKDVGPIISGRVGEAIRYKVERQGQRYTVELVAVSPDELVARPLELAVLVLDRDAAGVLLGALADRGVVATPDSEQEGVLHVHAPAEIATLLRATLDRGSQEGLWEVL